MPNLGIPNFYLIWSDKRVHRLTKEATKEFNHINWKRQSFAFNWSNRNYSERFINRSKHVSTLEQTLFSSTTVPECMRDCLERQNSKNRTVRRAKGFREQKNSRMKVGLGTVFLNFNNLKNSAYGYRGSALRSQFKFIKVHSETRKIDF